MEVFCRSLVLTLDNGTLSVNRDGEDQAVPTLEGRNRDRVFVDAVKSGASSHILSPYRDALTNFRLLMAVSESFRTGQVVDL